MSFVNGLQGVPKVSHGRFTATLFLGEHEGGVEQEAEHCHWQGLPARVVDEEAGTQLNTL